MVKIVDLKEFKKANGDIFVSLIVEGQLESVVSKSTGKIYLTKKRALVATTLDKETAAELIGTELSGKVIRVETEPYEYELDNKKTITLNHRWEYIDPSLKVVEENVMLDEHVVR